MNNKNIKEEFINAFGEEKWNELEILKPLQDAVDLVCKEYLGIEPIPVVSLIINIRMII